MIEIICKEPTQQQTEEKFQAPKNIRQVGSPRGRHKIYMEDYVYTFLHTMSKKQEACAAVLLGKSRVSRDIRYTFISGAVECTAAMFQWENIRLDDSFWEYIYKEEKQYFEGTEIVGWFLGKNGQEMELTPGVESAHRKYFAGRDKVLMLMDAQEGEESFFVYEQGYLQKREGYYIYYEKNISMQEYMVSKKEEEAWNLSLSEEFAEPQTEEEQAYETDNAKAREIHAVVQERKGRIQDDSELEELRKELREIPAEEKIFVKSNLEEPKTQAEEALETYRNMMLERQGKQVEKHGRKLLYMASSFFMIVICIIGITTINNYRKMVEVEDALNVMNLSVSGQDTQEDKEDLVVKNVESQVEPLEENQTQETSGQPQGTENIQPGQTGMGETEQPQEAGQSQETGINTGDGQTQETGATPSTAEQPQYYTVKEGDTLDSICMSVYQNRNMLESLCQANGIENGDKIYVGQKLLLP